MRVFVKLAFLRHFFGPFLFLPNAEHPSDKQKTEHGSQWKLRLFSYFSVYSYHDFLVPTVMFFGFSWKTINTQTLCLNERIIHVSTEVKRKGLVKVFFFSDWNQKNRNEYTHTTRKEIENIKRKLCNSTNPLFRNPFCIKFILHCGTLPRVHILLPYYYCVFCIFLVVAVHALVPKTPGNAGLIIHSCHIYSMIWWASDY